VDLHLHKVDVLVLLCPRVHRLGHNAMTAVVCLSVSVCPVPDPKSRTEGLSKVKVGVREAHDTGDP